jgi:hypothetical protein
VHPSPTPKTDPQQPQPPITRERDGNDKPPEGREGADSRRTGAVSQST